MQNKRHRRCRGQATTESLLVFMLLLFILCALVQVAYLYMNQMIAHHTANVTARSYVVGFEEDVVQRAREVGSIGLAGHLTIPPAYAQLTPAELAALEPMLIEQFLLDPGYSLAYERWHLVDSDMPTSRDGSMADIRIEIRNYPLDMPMTDLYMRDDTVDFQSEATLHNHASYYLE